MKAIDAFKKSKKVYSKLRVDRVKQKPKYELGQVVHTAVIRRVFSKGDSTSWSDELYTITEVIHVIIRSYKMDCLHEKFNENLIRSKNLVREENNQVMKEITLIQKYNKN